MSNRKICPTCEGSGYIIPVPSETKIREKHDFYEHLEDKHQKLRTTRNFEKGDDTDRRLHLPSNHPDHLCGYLCDGQDGVMTSECARTRIKLFGKSQLTVRERLRFVEKFEAKQAAELPPRKPRNITCFTCGESVDNGKHFPNQPCPETLEVS